MRDFVQFEAQHRAAYGRFTWLVRMWRNVRTRKDLHLLQALDDHSLRDIGLMRNDVERLLAMSHRVDLMWEVERVKRLRGR
jgi:uncharacterized protein YjiS (DUF1127 family)